MFTTKDKHHINADFYQNHRLSGGISRVPRAIAYSINHNHVTTLMAFPLKSARVVELQCHKPLHVQDCNLRSTLKR